MTTTDVSERRARYLEACLAAGMDPARALDQAREMEQFVAGPRLLPAPDAPLEPLPIPNPADFQPFMTHVFALVAGTPTTEIPGESPGSGGASLAGAGEAERQAADPAPTPEAFAPEIDEGGTTEAAESTEERAEDPFDDDAGAEAPAPPADGASPAEPDPSVPSVVEPSPDNAGAASPVADDDLPRRKANGRIVWDDDAKALLGRLWQDPALSEAEVAERFGLKVSSLRIKASQLGLGYKRPVPDPEAATTPAPDGDALETAIAWLNRNGYAVSAGAAPGRFRCTGAEWSADGLIGLARQFRAKTIEKLPPAYVGEVEGGRKLEPIPSMEERQSDQGERLIAKLKGRPDGISGQRLGLDLGINAVVIGQILGPYVRSGRVRTAKRGGRSYYWLAGGGDA